MLIGTSSKVNHEGREMLIRTSTCRVQSSE